MDHSSKSALCVFDDFL